MAAALRGAAREPGPAGRPPTAIAARALTAHPRVWQVALGPGQDRAAAKSFAGGCVHFHELLVLEKPPEMSKKKRKKRDADDADAPNGDAERGPSANYRMMFSLFRREHNGGLGGVRDGASEGRHLTFTMAPGDILIRNSFHMLSEAEKEARRAEYRAISDGSSRRQERASVKASALALPRPDKAARLAAVSPPLLGVSLGATHAPPADMSNAMVAATSSEAEPPPAPAARPPVLIAISRRSGGLGGGTEVWAHGRRFTPATHVLVSGVVASRCTYINEKLLTFITPPAMPGTGAVEVRATNGGCAWSAPLPFTYVENESDGGAGAEGELMERQARIILFRDTCHAVQTFSHVAAVTSD